MAERLQKVLAGLGVASRREAERLIAAGRVTVNGQLVTQMGQSVDPETDSIELDGQLLAQKPPLTYLLLNKPVGYMVSRHDPHAKHTVYELLPQKYHYLHPVGRLDSNSAGLLLLTNDGELTQRLLHPRHKVLKRYQVRVRGQVKPDQLQALCQGILLDDGPTQPAKILLKHPAPQGAWLEFNLREGKKRQIRRMCKAMGWQVEELIRFEMGPLKLGRLLSGQTRLLRPQEIAELRQAAGLAS